MKKIILFNFLLLHLLIAKSQNFLFSTHLKIQAVEKVRSYIRKGEVYSVIGLSWDIPTASYYIFAKDSVGTPFEFSFKELQKFEFVDVDNIEKVWIKHQLLNETHANLLSKGYQYDVRHDMHNESINYLNVLRSNYRFYNDDYLEDFMYSIALTIHKGVLDDKRPGNISVKIVTDTEPNAFCLPSGTLIITTGLLSTIQSEDELAAVLAHEIAHFVLDHQILSFNKEADRKKSAEFWATFATVIAAGADAYLAANSRNHIPGVLTATTAIGSAILARETLIRLGVQYNYKQELEADLVAKDILKILKYDTLALSAALSRIKNYSIQTGNYESLYGSSTHPSIDERIQQIGLVNDFSKFTKATFLKKVSFINTYNSRIELWYFGHHQAAMDLANRNITNGVGTESDYIVKSIVMRRLSNTVATNHEALELLSKAKTLNVIPDASIHKEEGITYLRLSNKVEAKKCFQNYLSTLLELRNKTLAEDCKAISSIDNEISWSRKMIYKVDNL